MLGVARLGDRTRGICKAHSSPKDVEGTIITASIDTMCDHFGVARNGDIILSDCGHTATIVTSSIMTIDNNLGVARIGDIGIGDYECTIVTASTTTLSG